MYLHRLAGGPVSFALTSGGHNVGIVNPPAGPAAYSQASYRFAACKPGRAPANPQDWLGAAEQRTGSWWPCWREWLHQHSSGTVKSPAPHGLMLDGATLAAPGSYVHLD